MRYQYENINKLNSIEVTLAMGCKLDCYYCPQRTLLREYFKDNPKRSSQMDFDTFRSILKHIKPGGTICFSGMCEAFLNPECDEMILYAYEKGFKLTLLTTLVGLKKESIYKLENVKFDSITLHIPDQEGNSKFNITSEYIEILKLFHQKFKITSYSCHGTIHPAVKPYIHSEIAYSNKMIDRAGNLDYGEKYAPKGEVLCMVGTIGSYGNWTPEVLPDGTLLLCCMDYGMQHVLGNLLNMTVKEIFESGEYQKVCQGMKDDTSDILCRKCNGAIPIEKTPAHYFLKKRKEYAEDKEIDMEPRQKEIVRLFEETENICVFGMGKLFWDNFFNQRWNEVLGENYFCDNSNEFWGKEIDGIPCISPEQLKNLKNPLVVVHVTEDKDIRKQLASMGISHVINIQELYKAF